jgi:NAD(P)-dependent dehydrogenase (short-subunit alcohol dehydrogenase family)
MQSFAIVTGASGEIGLEISKKLHSDGLSVIGIDLKFSEWGNFHEFFIGNVSDLILINEVFSVAKEAHRLILVNCAGVTFPTERSIDSWSATLDVNLTAPYLWMEAFVDFVSKGTVSGSILNITSLAAEKAFPNNPAYAASKGGLKLLTKSYAYQLGPKGITCNSLGPGYIETDFNSASLQNKDAYLERQNRTLLGRWGTVNDIAQVASFLVSESANYITGQDIYVDGGWLAKGL